MLKINSLVINNVAVSLYDISDSILHMSVWGQLTELAVGVAAVWSIGSWNTYRGSKFAM